MVAHFPAATLPNPRPFLSAFLIVHDEASHIGDCLASLRGLADEIVVLDDGSTDATVDIARAAGARVEHRPFDDFGRQKQAALELTTGTWVLSIDADERVTPALAAEIRRTIADANAADGYWIRRELIYLGTRLRHGGAERDWVLRLARRDRAKFSAVPIHERILIDGREARLRGTIDHIKYRTLAEHVAQINRYTDVIARQKRERGGEFRAWHLLRIKFELFSRLVLRLGILDGRAGIIHAAMASWYAFLKFAKMWPPDGGGGSGADAK
jgi:glycosyltransferase involved in cell wall biosynthesis